MGNCPIPVAEHSGQYLNIFNGFSKAIVQRVDIALRVVKASLASVAAVEAIRGEHAPTDEGGY